MSIIFLGSGEFALPPLERLAASSWRPALVVTRPDRPGRRGLKPVPTPVRARAEGLGLPVEAPASANDPAFIARLREIAPEVAIVVDYGEILRDALLGVPRIGTFNLHGSLLPRHRGAAPVVAALLAGDAETGVTLFRITRGLDCGPIVARASTPVGPDETAGELEARLAVLAAGLLAGALPLLLSGGAAEEPQREDLATMAPKIPKGAGAIDWGLDPARLSNFIRAMSPRPGAHAFLRRAGREGEPVRLRLLRARAVEEAGTPEAPGTLTAAGKTLIRAACGAGGAGRIEILEVQPAGKDAMTAAEWLRGARLAPGDRLSPD